jgi:hypothetical protein
MVSVQPLLTLGAWLPQLLRATATGIVGLSVAAQVVLMKLGPGPVVLPIAQLVGSTATFAVNGTGVHVVVIQSGACAGGLGQFVGSTNMGGAFVAGLLTTLHSRRSQPLPELAVSFMQVCTAVGFAIVSVNVLHVVTVSKLVDGPTTLPALQGSCTPVVRVGVGQVIRVQLGFCGAGPGVCSVQLMTGTSVVLFGPLVHVMPIHWLVALAVWLAGQVVTNCSTDVVVGQAVVSAQPFDALPKLLGPVLKQVPACTPTVPSGVVTHDTIWDALVPGNAAQAAWLAMLVDTVAFGVHSVMSGPTAGAGGVLFTPATQVATAMLFTLDRGQSVANQLLPAVAAMVLQVATKVDDSVIVWPATAPIPTAAGQLRVVHWLVMDAVCVVQVPWMKSVLFIAVGQNVMISALPRSLLRLHVPDIPWAMRVTSVQAVMLNGLVLAVTVPGVQLALNAGACTVMGVLGHVMRGFALAALATHAVAIGWFVAASAVAVQVVVTKDALVPAVQLPAVTVGDTVTVLHSVVLMNGDVVLCASLHDATALVAGVLTAHVVWVLLGAAPVVTAPLTHVPLSGMDAVAVVGVHVMEVWLFVLLGIWVDTPVQVWLVCGTDVLMVSTQVLMIAFASVPDMHVATKPVLNVAVLQLTRGEPVVTSAHEVTNVGVMIGIAVQVIFLKEGDEGDCTWQTSPFGVFSVCGMEVTQVVVIKLLLMSPVALVQLATSSGPVVIEPSVMPCSTPLHI